MNPPAGWTTIGDSVSVVLFDGTFMQANCCTNQAALLNERNLTWTPTGRHKYDTNNEEGWTLLPSGKVLTVDAYVPIAPFPYIPDGTNTELYDPRTGAWSSAGSTVVQLWVFRGELRRRERGLVRAGAGCSAPGWHGFLRGFEQLRPRQHGNLQFLYRDLDPGSCFSGFTGHRRWPGVNQANGKVLLMTSP